LSVSENSIKTWVDSGRESYLEIQEPLNKYFCQIKIKADAQLKRVNPWGSK
jgi:hypothetical protein